MTPLKRIHVPAGSYVIKGESPVILQAFLSSCVGVALYDPENKIGGVSHFLLPEPVSSCAPDSAHKYASTGLPLFINNLVENGASLKSMRACIAGGAFSGILSRQDIDLDIGGRTVETVQALLKDQNIQVDRTETGGFFTCCLNLDMRSWEPYIAPIIPSDPIKEDPSPNYPDTDTLESMLFSLAPIPQIALKVLRMIHDDEASTHSLAKEVKKDQVISAEVIKHCNTAIFSGKSKIDTIDDALLIIGQTNLARIITTITVKPLFNQNRKGYSLVKGGLYHHAIGVALLSEKIAQHFDLAHPFSAYTAGLLHDIGKIALDQFVAARAPLFYRDLQHTTNSSIEIENRYLNTDHTQIGQKIASLWSLPESISNVITNHHMAASCGLGSRNVHIVALSDLLLHMFNAGPQLSRVDLNQFSALFETLSLSVTHFPEIIDLIPLPVLMNAPEMML